VGIEAAGENSVAKDGLSASKEPLPREAAAAPETEAGTEARSPTDASNNSAARKDVEGLNKAAGPAEEADDQVEDDRFLTTDISPSD
jgi:hypothetical protein